MTSSSSSMPPPYEAIVRRGGEEIGPIRLPLDDREQFIKDFNQIYHDHKMSVVATRCLASCGKQVSPFAPRN